MLLHFVSLHKRETGLRWEVSRLNVCQSSTHNRIAKMEPLKREREREERSKPRNPFDLLKSAYKLWPFFPSKLASVESISEPVPKKAEMRSWASGSNKAQYTYFTLNRFLLFVHGIWSEEKNFFLKGVKHFSRKGRLRLVSPPPCPFSRHTISLG